MIEAVGGAGGRPWRFAFGPNFTRFAVYHIEGYDWLCAFSFIAQSVILYT